MKRLFLAVLMVAVCDVVHAQEGVTARVLGHRVNLRAKAVANSEVVGQVSDGDILQVKSVQVDWVEVSPPENIELWLHRDFVSDDTVAGTRVNVRAGPGINYTVVGILNRGDKVVIKGTFGEWVRVAPFPAASVWVSKDLVQIAYPPSMTPVEPALPAPADAVAAATNAEAATLSADAPDKPAMPSAAPDSPVALAAEPDFAPPPADLKLIPLEGQGRRTKYEGLVRKAPVFGPNPADYRLVVIVAQRAKTVCYLRGNRQQLESLAETNLRIHGREYWVKGVKEPVLVVELIEKLPAVSPAH